jgi:hypothetical protein
MNPALDGMAVIVHGLGEANPARTEKITATSWKYLQVIEL